MSSSTSAVSQTTAISKTSERPPYKEGAIFPIASCKQIWDSTVPYLIPPVAASIAIVPVFYGFIVKSAQQIGSPIPKMPIGTVLRSGFAAAPTIGITVGLQMGAQNEVEKFFPAQKETSDVTSMVFSSVIVGAISVPPLAVLNGKSMGQTAMASLKGLSSLQAGAIIIRETSFLFALRVSTPLSEYMKSTLGDNKAVEYGSAFTSGAISSIIGHPADTALTFWQKKMKIDGLRCLMRGSMPKALAVGGFSAGYQFTKNVLNQTDTDLIVHKVSSVFPVPEKVSNYLFL